MHILDLPPSRCLDRLALGLVSGSTAAVLLSGIQWPWRLGLAGVTVATGLGLWHRYRYRRPARLRVAGRQRLACCTRDGTPVTVSAVHLGVVRPCLASATLIGEGGERFALFVPACAMGESEHWHLRRALLAWRPPDGDDTGTTRRHRQRIDRRGT